jgi:hypothetical protein
MKYLEKFKDASAETASKINLIALSVCIILSVIGIIDGDIIDFIFGAYTLM